MTKDVFGADARPAVFALSNPGDVAECTAQQAYDWSGGAAVYTSGTAFPPVRRADGTTFVPAQCNNCLIFPGAAVVSGLLLCGDAAETMQHSSCPASAGASPLGDRHATSHCCKGSG